MTVVYNVHAEYVYDVNDIHDTKDIHLFYVGQVFKGVYILHAKLILVHAFHMYIHDM